MHLFYSQLLRSHSNYCLLCAVSSFVTSSCAIAVVTCEISLRHNARIQIHCFAIITSIPENTTHHSQCLLLMFSSPNWGAPCGMKRAQEPQYFMNLNLQSWATGPVVKSSSLKLSLGTSVHGFWSPVTSFFPPLNIEWNVQSHLLSGPAAFQQLDQTVSYWV